MTDVERNFYRAMEITVEGLAAYIARYADLAETLLKSPRPGECPDALEHIRAICRKISWEPAQTFPEALQMMWFIMCFMDYDSFGRFDQYIWPAYETSRSAGMTEEEACRWMQYYLDQDRGMRLNPQYDHRRAQARR